MFCRNDEHPKRIDLLVEDKIVIELKTVNVKHPIFASQCRTYLRMMNLPVGLVLNFGFQTLKEGLEHVCIYEDGLHFSNSKGCGGYIAV